MLSYADRMSLNKITGIRRFSEIRLRMSVDRVFHRHVSGGICNDLFRRRVCLSRNARQEPGIMRGRI